MRLDLVDLMDGGFRSALRDLHITIEEVSQEENAYAYIVRRIREIQAAEDQE